MKLDRPLDGVRVLDLGWYLPTPFCSLILADLGAEVIKIERARGGDPTRQFGDALFTVLNRGKKSLAIDLKAPEARGCFAQLIETSDVVLEGFRPGVAARLGVDYPTLAGVNERLIYLSLSGFGQSGPLRDTPGHDINFLAISGILSIPGHVGERPRRSGLPLADLSAAQYAASAVVSALFARERTGRGRFLDIAMAEVALYLAQIRFADYFASGSSWTHTTPLNDVFSTADGREVAIAFGVPGEERFIEALFRAAERPFDLSDYLVPGTSRLDQAKLQPVIAELIASKASAEWERILPQADVPISRVNSPEEALSELHFAARGMLAESGMSGLAPACRVVTAPGLPPDDTESLAPRLGQHSAEVLSSAEIPGETIGRLIEQGSIVVN